MFPPSNAGVSSLVSSSSSLISNTAAAARQHARSTIIAASAVAASVIGALCVSATIAPWAQAADNTTQAVRVEGSLVAWGQSATRAVSSLQTGKATAGTPPDRVHAASTSSSTGKAVVAVSAVEARHVAPVHDDVKVVKARVGQKAVSVTPKSYLIYDSVTPGSIPAGEQAAVYVNGAYAASASEASSHGSVLWIDTNGTDPAANVLDVEPGDATPAAAAAWAQQRLSQHPRFVAIIYTMRSDWPQVKADVAGLPQWMQPRVHYWIADPTGVPHVLAGASATQWYWGHSYDLTTAIPGFEG